MKIDENGGRHPTIVPDVGIFGFYDGYRFLSNYHLCKIELDGRIYNSSEAAYMAMKCYNYDDRGLFIGDITPNNAKKLGNTVLLRPDWEHYRLIAMMQVLTAKFTQNQDLYDKLLATDGLYLEETNNWKDTFWGVDYNSNEGYNMLGKCLMAVRSAIK